MVEQSAAASVARVYFAKEEVLFQFSPTDGVDLPLSRDPPPCCNVF